jgi:hypothetical protein
MFGFFRSLAGLVYLLIGVAVAASHHYFTHGHLHHVKGIVSAALAIVLWPLILLGVNLHLH